MPGNLPETLKATTSGLYVGPGGWGLDEPAYRAFAIAVLRIEDGRIVEVSAFHDPGLFPAFALPTALAPTHR